VQAPFRGQPLQSPERPDVFFGLVAGLYVAALVSPAVVLAVGVLVSVDAGVLHVGLLASLTVVTAGVAWGVGRWPGFAEWLGSSRLSWLLPVAGFGAMIAYAWPAFLFLATTIAGLPTGGAASAVGVTGFLLGVVAILLGSALRVMARNRLVDALVGDETARAEWQAGWPRRRRMWVQGDAAVVMVLVVLVMLVSLWQGADWGFNVFAILGPMSAVLVSLGTKRTYRVTSVGLEREYPVARRLLTWDQFSGVEVSDDAIVLRRQFPRLDVRCAREDLDDEEAVLAALAAYLDRLD
jgi:hypothetical protein